MTNHSLIGYNNFKGIAKTRIFIKYHLLSEIRK